MYQSFRVLATQTASLPRGAKCVVILRSNCDSALIYLAVKTNNKGKRNGDERKDELLPALFSIPLSFTNARSSDCFPCPPSQNCGPNSYLGGGVPTPGSLRIFSSNFFCDGGCG